MGPFCTDPGRGPFLMPCRQGGRLGCYMLKKRERKSWKGGESSGVVQALVQILALLLASCVALCRLLKLSASVSPSVKWVNILGLL